LLCRCRMAEAVVLIAPGVRWSRAIWTDLDGFWPLRVARELQQRGQTNRRESGKPMKHFAFGYNPGAHTMKQAEGALSRAIRSAHAIRTSEVVQVSGSCGYHGPYA